MSQPNLSPEWDDYFNNTSITLPLIARAPPSTSDEAFTPGFIEELLLVLMRTKSQLSVTELPTHKGAYVDTSSQRYFTFDFCNERFNEAGLNFRALMDLLGGNTYDFAEAFDGTVTVGVAGLQVPTLRGSYLEQLSVSIVRKTLQTAGLSQSLVLAAHDVPSALSSVHLAWMENEVTDQEKAQLEGDLDRMRPLFNRG